MKVIDLVSHNGLLIKKHLMIQEEKMRRIRIIKKKR